MMRKILTVTMLLILLCPAAWANQEILIKLDNRAQKIKKESLGFADITFECLNIIGNKARVQVTIDNITQNPPLALLIFQQEQFERTLKQSTPKIVFEKKFPGQKGRRRVLGCDECSEQYTIILSEGILVTETAFVFKVDVPIMDSKHIVLPFYIASYKPKMLQKKGKRNTKYKILEERIFDFSVQVEGWTPDDPDYLHTKKAVEALVLSLKDVTFCDNKKHAPSLEEQQQKYTETIDSLKAVINVACREWMSLDPAFIAYAQLLELLNIDLREKIKDCGRHVVVHKCGYCSLSDQQLYHKLDDTYQQLYAGRITKEEAARIARGVNACYRNNANRKKDTFYGNQITNFYNQILKY